MDQKIVVTPTLSVQPATNALGGLGVWIERVNGGLVWLQLEEIGGLVAALTEAQAHLVAWQRGEKYEGNVF